MIPAVPQYAGGSSHVHNDTRLNGTFMHACESISNHSYQILLCHLHTWYRLNKHGWEKQTFWNIIRNVMTLHLVFRESRDTWLNKWRGSLKAGVIVHVIVTQSMRDWFVCTFQWWLMLMVITVFSHRIEQLIGVQPGYNIMCSACHCMSHLMFVFVSTVLWLSFIKRFHENKQHVYMYLLIFFLYTGRETWLNHLSVSHFVISREPVYTIYAKIWSVNKY